MRKVLMFVSSYIPLYLLLAVRNILDKITIKDSFITGNEIVEKIKTYNPLNSLDEMMVLILLAVSIISFKFLIKMTKTETNRVYYSVLEYNDESANYFFNYISLYLLSSFGFDIGNIVDVFSFFFIMFLIGYVYVTSNLTYINPVLYLMGYRVYAVILQSDEKYSKETIQTNMVTNKEINLKENVKILASSDEDFVVFSKLIDEKI
ncbi:hypothetical protein [Facklamia miroungae]|uniref:Uncharacterized protein n=1 Tax=Facklamia miroungae TaxID=120956 RepID=A0A1G7REX1_9LACT|nr:hypothetical protein [Facklamia miroungae]NKZ29442.1 hypothetical protein [Facklamia miroungae]SDG09195.1 hypothetical protein SAMN05421791_10313 [Facklamia miroungae]